MRKIAMAIAAHPDDIEFLMAGTLLRLQEVGYEIHYLNLSSGHLGSMTIPVEELKQIRWTESQAAAKVLNAVIHPSLTHDMEILYELPLIQKLAAVIRNVQPEILLTHALEDYMEDHQNTARVAVSAAFVRGMPNYQTQPQVTPTQAPVTVYHAQPHGNRTPLREWVIPEIAIDVTSVMSVKRAALATHASQKDWLDETQGMDSYLDAMTELNRQVGEMSGVFQYAEGWRKRLHYGFCAEDADPLTHALEPSTSKYLH
jgi:LmbE family N-acetylglucosaminyl deacetylase